MVLRDLPAGLDLARTVVSAKSGEAAIPLDLFASSLPRIWKQRLSHGGRLLLVNCEDEAQEIRLDKTVLDGVPAQVTDFWQAGRLPVHRKWCWNRIIVCFCNGRGASVSQQELGAGDF